MTLQEYNIKWHILKRNSPLLQEFYTKHSEIYGHKNETQILEMVAFIVQFYTYFNTYDMN